MFILYCDRDNSYCKIDDSEVIFDADNPPENEENVIFFYNNKKETGSVVMKSDDIKQINKRYEALKKSSNKRKSLTSTSEKDDGSLTIHSKRLRKVTSKYPSSSLENLDSKTQKTKRKNAKGNLEGDNKKNAEKIIQLSIENEIMIDKKVKITTSPKKVPVPSPSKDELKRKLEDALREIAVSKKRNATAKLDETHSSISKITDQPKQKTDEKVQDADSFNSTTETDLDDSLNKENVDSSDWNSSESHGHSADTTKIIELKGNNGSEKKNEFEHSTLIKNNEKDPIVDHTGTDLDDPDLYGKDWPGEKMVKLIDKVYCKESDFIPVKSMCSQASHVVRRLVTGVFKPSGYLNATFSGQAPRAHTGQGKPAPVKSLNDIAKNEIIDYALKLAIEKKWKTKKGIPQTREELQRAMSQRIGELKRSHELSNKKQTTP